MIVSPFEGLAGLGCLLRCCTATLSNYYCFKSQSEENFESHISHIECKNRHPFSDYVHTMPANFENGEKCDGSKILASVHTIPVQFENG